MRRRHNGAGIGSRWRGAIGVPHRDPNGKTAIIQMGNDASAEKSGSTENRHRLPGHNATLFVRSSLRNRAAARAGPIALVYAARDEAHNDAVVLQEMLTGERAAN